MKTRKIYTKKPMVWKSFLLPKADADGWLVASARTGLSRAEFLRTALREKVSRTLIQPDQRVSQQ